MPINDDFYVQWTVGIGPYVGVPLTVPHTSEGVGDICVVAGFLLGATHRLDCWVHLDGLRTTVDVIRRQGGNSMAIHDATDPVPSSSSLASIFGIPVGTGATSFTFRMNVVNDVVRLLLNGVPISGPPQSVNNPFYNGIGNVAGSITLTEPRTSAPSAVITLNYPGQNFGSGMQNYPGVLSGFSTDARAPGSPWWTDFHQSFEA